MANNDIHTKLINTYIRVQLSFADNKINSLTCNVYLIFQDICYNNHRATAFYPYAREIKHLLSAFKIHTLKYNILLMTCLIK